jgi:hypothetical protein
VELDLDALSGQWVSHRALARSMIRTNGLTETSNFQWLCARTVERLGLSGNTGQ